MKRQRINEELISNFTLLPKEAFLQYCYLAPGITNVCIGPIGRKLTSGNKRIL
jgi:hypothetical protein